MIHRGSDIAYILNGQKMLTCTSTHTLEGRVFSSSSTCPSFVSFDFFVSQLPLVLLWLCVKILSLLRRRPFYTPVIDVIQFSIEKKSWERYRERERIFFSTNMREHFMRDWFSLLSTHSSHWYENAATDYYMNPTKKSVRFFFRTCSHQNHDWII